MLRRISAGIGVVVLAAVLAGCGSNDIDTDYDELSEKDFAGAVTKAMADMKTAHLEMEIADVAMSMDVRFDRGEQSEMAVAGTVDDGNAVVDLILVDGDLFVRGPGADRYLKLPEETSQATLQQLETSNPAEMARTFKAGIDTVEYAGTDEFNGETLHRYDLKMKKAVLAQQANVPVSEVTDVRYRLWLDGRNLMRRMAFTVQDQKVLLRMSDWGEQVKIQAPPAQQVQQ